MASSVALWDFAIALSIASPNILEGTMLLRILKPKAPKTAIAAIPLLLIILTRPVIIGITKSVPARVKSSKVFCSTTKGLVSAGPVPNNSSNCL